MKTHLLLNPKLSDAAVDACVADSALLSRINPAMANNLQTIKSKLLFADILNKLTNLKNDNQVVVCIGPSFNSSISDMLIDLSQTKRHRLILVDTHVALEQLPSTPLIKKIPANNHQECKDIIQDHPKRIDVILAYGVLHHMLMDIDHVYDFVDDVITLMAINGQCLIGDLPNASKRERFLTSKRGVLFPQKIRLQTVENALISQHLNDAVLAKMIDRVRSKGLDAYLMPQQEGLPKANRREDILIIRP